MGSLFGDCNEVFQLCATFGKTPEPPIGMVGDSEQVFQQPRHYDRGKYGGTGSGGLETLFARCLKKGGLSAVRGRTRTERSSSGRCWPCASFSWRRGICTTCLGTVAVSSWARSLSSSFRGRTAQHLQREVSHRTVR